jgi:hypothetical protein
MEGAQILFDIPKERKSTHIISELMDDWKNAKNGTRAIVKDPTSPSKFSVAVLNDNNIELYHLYKGEIPFELKGGFGNHG